VPSTPPPSTRQALLDGAISLFLTQGFDATSMEQVRSAAGASNGSLYHHFPSKSHLARAVYEDALRDYQANLRGALGDKVSAKEGVQSLVKRHIAWVLRSPQLARVLNELRPFTAIDGHEPDWESVNAEAFLALKKWIARHVAEGTLQDLPFEVWMALVFAPVMQLTSAWARQERLRVAPRVVNALAQAAWRSVCVANEMEGK
jgi:AcrR family transcriptional regulator